MAVSSAADARQASDTPDAEPSGPALSRLLPWRGAPLRGGKVRIITTGDGLRAISVDAPAVRATVYLQGAQLTEWTPTGQDPVLFMSPASAYRPGVALRGGVPICAPWFGGGPDGSLRPHHGWARLREWDLCSVRATEEGGVEMILSLPAERLDADAAPSGVALSLRLLLGSALEMTLTATNTSDHDVSPELALHAYWSVDARRAALTGLDAIAYTDRTAHGEPRRSAGAFPAIAGETIDRIYPRPQPGPAALAIHDPGQSRDIMIGTDAAQLVVWNPGSRSCHDAADLAEDDWTHMMCVEAARVRDHAAPLAPGASISLGLTARIRTDRTPTACLPRLGRDLVDPVRRPTRIIQFGEGNFLRAFVDWAVQKLDERTGFDGGVAVVQPRPGGRVADLEAQDRLYTVQIQGLQDGRPVLGRDLITVINKTVDPYRDWNAFLALAEDPDSTVVVSNTTEAGIAIDPRDTARTPVPRGFPAKLTRLLERRHRVGLPGLLIIACELIDDNGRALHDAVIQCARAFGLNSGFIDWVDSENTFCSSLVDRIVPGFPTDDAGRIWAELGYRDDQLVCAEPFLLWVIQGPDRVMDLLPFGQAGLDVVLADDLRPYHDRKVLLLNGPHTTMASLARLAGFQTVGEAMDDEMLRGFIRAEMRDEIFPVIDLPDDELERFSAQVEERFRNPFVHHRLDSIALNAVSKFTARLLPVIRAHATAGDPPPRRIVLALAGLLWSYSGESPAAAVDTEETIARFDGVLEPGGAAAVLSDATLWGSDLTDIPGLPEAVQTDLDALRHRGAPALIAELSQQEH